MVFPVGDDNSDRHSTPLITWTIIAINILVFTLLQGCGSDLSFTYAFSTVPEEILTGQDIVSRGTTVQDPATGYTVDIPGLQPTPFSVYLTLLTSMFMHGGFGHIFGNMMFLSVFGDNVENALGRMRYLLFYVLTGLAAALSHIMATYMVGANPLIPMLGASGAISGVLGGYLLLFPGRRVRVVIFYMLQDVPAVVAIGLWFLFQIISGLGMLGGKTGGVAYGAHIGGFVAGLVLVKLFAAGRPPVEVYRSGSHVPPRRSMPPY
jgi:membrane associated rhomboid family serine protease